MAKKNKKRAQTEPSNTTDKPVFRPRINNCNYQNYINVLVRDKAEMAEWSNATGSCPVFRPRKRGFETSCKRKSLSRRPNLFNTN